MPAPDFGSGPYCSNEPDDGQAFLPGGTLGFCCEDARAPSPERGTFVDLSAYAPGSEGTCGNFRDTAPGAPDVTYVLPSDASMYPLRIRLPAVTGADPACATFCAEDSARDRTAFGIAMELPSSLHGFMTGRAIAIRAPAPWRVVSGGNGEAYPWPCLSGYQEFGVHGCRKQPYGDFGFATAATDAPSADAIVELVDVEPGAEHERCCPYDAP